MVCRSLTTFLFLNLILMSIIPARADIVNYNLDPTQSYVDVTVDGVGPDRSRTSGTGVLHLSPSIPPFGTAQITEMDVLLEEALLFSFAGGLVTATTTAGDLTINLVTPGAAGTVSSNQFNQTGNQMGLGGNVDISDPNNLSGGDATIDLSALSLSLVDFTNVTLSRTGDVMTISGSYNIDQMVDVGGEATPINIAGVFVATGIVSVPEPGGMIVLLAMLGIAAGRRRN